MSCQKRCDPRSWAWTHQIPWSQRSFIEWGAVRAIFNFTMDLGSIKYPCAPFSSFVSIEIARNLLERNNGTEPLAEAFEMDVSDKLLHQKVSAELETVAFFRKEQVCGGRSHVSWEIPHDALYVSGKGLKAWISCKIVVDLWSYEYICFYSMGKLSWPNLLAIFTPNTLKD